MLAFSPRGTKVNSQKDLTGKLSRWGDYMSPRPGQTQPSHKWSFVKAVNIDGFPWPGRLGLYPQ